MAITRIQLRRGTAAEWTSANTVLEVGEPGFESDTGREKIGDGVTAWADLAYMGGSGSYAPLLRAVSAAYAATVTPNADTTDVLNIGALTGNLTVAAPTGTPRDGQTLRVRLIQDGTGSRTVSWNAAFAFGTDVTAALEPTAASSKWERIFEWNATDSKWRATAIVRGF